MNDENINDFLVEGKSPNTKVEMATQSIEGAVELNENLTHFVLITEGEHKGAFVFNPKFGSGHSGASMFVHDRIRLEREALNERGFTVITPDPEPSIEMKAVLDEMKNAPEN